MNFYLTSFLLLISSCGLLSWQQYHNQEESPEKKSLTQSSSSPAQKAEASRFSRLFLIVYCLVMASDWLQGPYVYSLYKDQFELKETMVAGTSFLIPILPSVQF